MYVANAGVALALLDEADVSTDVAVYRPSNNNFYWSVNGGPQQIDALGWTGDIPVPGDYNGDGQTDVAVYRPSTATWYWDTTNNKQGVGISLQQFGLTGDIPAVSTLVLTLLQQYGLL